MHKLIKKRKAKKKNIMYSKRYIKYSFNTKSKMLAKQFIIGGAFFMDKNKKQYNEIKQNEIEKDNVGHNMEKINTNQEDENVEDTTKYGEFISSYFNWLPPEKQKKRAKELDDMTKK